MAFRIQAADIALCVVSCADMDHTRNDSSMELPASVKTLITDGTFILVNKIDLYGHCDPARFNGPNRWATSLKTGHGTTKFLAGFAQALQRKYEYTRILSPVW
jgi:tRNA modification GTPase